MPQISDFIKTYISKLKINLTETQLKQLDLLAENMLKDPLYKSVSKIFEMFSSVSLLLLVTFTHSLLASINKVLFSFLDLLNTIMQVAIEVPKNKLSGSCIIVSMKLLSIKY